MKTLCLQVSRMAIKEQGRIKKGPISLTLLFFHPTSFITPPFLSFFSLFCFSLEGECFFYNIRYKPIGSPKNLQDDPVGIIVAQESYNG